MARATRASYAELMAKGTVSVALFGLMALDTLVIGKWDKQQDTEFFTMLMGTFLKANFRLIKRMVRELTVIRPARRIQAIGFMIFSMERGLKFYLMVQLTKVTSGMAKNQGRVRTVGLTGHLTRASGTTIS